MDNCLLHILSPIISKAFFCLLWFFIYLIFVLYYVLNIVLLWLTKKTIFYVIFYDECIIKPFVFIYLAFPLFKKINIMVWYGGPGIYFVTWTLFFMIVNIILNWSILCWMGENKVIPWKCQHTNITKHNQRVLRISIVFDLIWNRMSILTCFDLMQYIKGLLQKINLLNSSVCKNSMWTIFPFHVCNQAMQHSQ